MNTNTRRHGVRTGERGSALVGVLLLLLMMSALAAALGVSGQTETLVARNHESLAQARASAEAGLNHAVQVTISYLRTIDPANIPTTLNTLLVDTTALDGVAFGEPTAVQGAADADAAYEVLLMDEDDPDRDVVVTAIAGDDDENNDPLTDANQKIVIRAVGRARGNTTVTLEALLAPVELGAIVVDGDLTIQGSISVINSTDPLSEDADVHANGNLDINGNATVLQGDITASGTYEGMAAGMGGQPEKPLPNVRAEEYKHHAEYVLADTGLILCNMSGGCGAVANGGMVCDPGPSGNDCRDTYGWEFDGGGEWSLTSAGTALNGAFYVEGKATISTNDDTLMLTVIAEGSISLSGNPTLTSYTNELLFVTDADLKTLGFVSTDVVAQGQVLVHEQIDLGGNITLGGQVIVENATSIDPFVDQNSISGNVTVDYSGGLGTNQFFVVGWREVR